MDPNSGRVFKLFDDEEAKRRGLVPAPFVNRHQQRRMGVMRNEPCPCGSGKKFKKCCLGKTPEVRPAWMPPRVP